jgi:hypothetical protein
MPIVFEEVTGEIAPERGAPPSETATGTAPGAENIGEAVRHEMQLIDERQRRLRAD